MIEPASTQLYALHGIRAFAATLVAAAHLVLRLIKYEVIGSQWEWLASGGRAGVYTFFAISGYIMVKSSGRFFGSAAGSQEFLTRRLIRIAPIYYLFTIIFVLKLSAAGTPWTWTELVYSLLFIPYINADGLMQPIYSLGWTLDYEMYFYIIFAACLMLRRSIGIATVFVIISSVVVWGLFQGNFAPSGDPQNLFAFYAHPVALFFLAGMSIALAPRTFQAPPAICFTLSTICILAGIVSRQPAILAATCIGAVFLSSMERAPVRASIAEKSMEVLGEASYSIYLTHSFVLGPAVAIGLKLGFWNGTVGYIYALACLVACAIAGTIAYLVFERPTLRFIREYRNRMSYTRPAL